MNQLDCMEAQEYAKYCNWQRQFSQRFLSFDDWAKEKRIKKAEEKIFKEKLDKLEAAKRAANLYL